MVFFAPLMASVFAETVQGAPISIIVKKKATVNGDEIRLKDVMESCSDADLKKRIGNVTLTKAPRPGREKTIRGSRIISLLRTQNRLSSSTPADIAVPDRIRVVRAHQSVPHKRLNRLFHEYLVARMKDDADVFKVSRFSVRGVGVLPTGRIGFSALKPSSKKTTGRVSLPVRVYVDGEDVGKVVVSGWVDRYREVVCADRYLSRNTLLDSTDVRLEQINISRAPANLVTDIDLAVGKRLKQSVKEGKYLRSNMLALPPAVQKGDRIKLVAESGSLKVATVGIAKGSGGIGDQIRVENITSKKTVRGRVIDASTVEILF